MNPFLLSNQQFYKSLQSQCKNNRTFQQVLNISFPPPHANTIFITVPLSGSIQKTLYVSLSPIKRKLIPILHTVPKVSFPTAPHTNTEGTTSVCLSIGERRSLLINRKFINLWNLAKEPPGHKYSPIQKREL